LHHLSGERVAIGRRGQTQRLAQGVAGGWRTEHPGLSQGGDDGSAELIGVDVEHGGTHPHAVDQTGESRKDGHETGRVTDVALGAGHPELPRIEGGEAVGCRSAGAVEHHLQLQPDALGAGIPHGIDGARALNERDVRRGRARLGGVGRDRQLPLRGTGRDARALHRPVAAGEVGVVHPVTVDVPPGVGVTHDGVVFPCVPEQSARFHGVGGIAPRDGGGHRLAPVSGGDRDIRVGSDDPAGAAARGDVERGELGGEVERLGVHALDHGDQPDRGGERGCERCPLHRVDASRRPGGNGRVVEGEGGESGALGRGDPAGEGSGHASGEFGWRGRGGCRGRGGGMRAVAVEVDGDRERVAGHGSSTGVGVGSTVEGREGRPPCV
jgi:hypothetical protein